MVNNRSRTDALFCTSINQTPPAPNTYLHVEHTGEKLQKTTRTEIGFSKAEKHTEYVRSISEHIKLYALDRQTEQT